MKLIGKTVTRGKEIDVGGRREFIEERWEVWRINSKVQGNLAIVNVCDSGIYEYDDGV